ncbi:hypothetical protein B0H13DRAFT_2462179 [Mycena leptocephala]|nr:hypothetical protein B0H13DRAFT_2462179 [Mycena leptocephala]
MRFAVTLAILALTSLVSADSGIFAPNGEVLPSPTRRAVEGRSGAPRGRDLDSRSVGAKGGLEKKQTNFERMRRGLPPLPPARFANLKRPRPSPAPCAPLSSTSGYIKLTHTADQKPAGYLSSVFDEQNSYTLTTDPTLALTIELPSLSPFHGPFGISALDGDGPAMGYTPVGAVGGSGGISSGWGKSGEYAYLAGTGASPANTPPTSGAGTSLSSLGYNAPSESTIWALDCRTLEVSAQWTNDDLSQPATTIFHDPLVDFLGITADLKTFNAGFPGEGAVEMTFTFAPVIPV